MKLSVLYLLTTKKYEIGCFFAMPVFLVIAVISYYHVIFVYLLCYVFLLAVNCIYSESKKSSPPKTFCNIFTRVKYISVKFCRYVASLYLHRLTNFGRFVLIFNKMALIFLGVSIVFNVSSFKFY